jgi:hypothetical protein
MMQCVFTETSGFADNLCQGGGSPPMSLLPWQGFIHDLYDLPDQNGFDMSLQGTG